MTAGHAHKDLVFGVQALRRLVERDAVDLGGALGVRAMPYPHQLGTVHRVLTAPSVRHLLADEVGLGKTVQALMIVNAMRLQHTPLRTLVVVPNELRPQWRDEIWTRGHQAPVDEALEEDAQRRIRLAWPEVLKGDLSVIDPAAFEVLIVDEFHDLQLSIQERILTVAADFRGLLLISATPPFQDPKRRQDVLRMIEPTRMALAEAAGEGDGLEVARRREAAAARLLASDAGSDAWAEAGLYARPPGDAPARASTAAQTYSIHRRIVRTRRADYRSYMPAREHRPLTVEPTDAECDRQRLMWRYFQHLPTLTRDFDAELLAQRVIRSASSLQQRVTFLRGHGHEREGLLERVAPLLDRALGDSRFEALVDLIDAIWREEPRAKVIVAAGDNLTVEALDEQLPLALDGADGEGQRPRPRIAKIRNQGQEIIGADSLADPNDAIEAAVRAFVAGEANILLAAQVGKLGLNLQFTRHLVLYSVPWSPQEIEQWIGRVDRLGNQALRDRRGVIHPIQVYTIAQRGLVDERIRDVLAASSIFEQSVSLDGRHVKHVTDGIRAAGLGEVGDWQALLDEARGIRRALTDLDSPLRESLPWGPTASQRLFDRVVGAPPIPPHTITESSDPLVARERALSAWIDALGATGEYVIKRDKRFGGRTLAYAYAEVGSRRSRPLKSRGALKEVFPDPREADGRFKAPFIERRAAIRLPARREVAVTSDHKKPLYYLSHGSPLHEELVASWLALGRDGARCYELSVDAADSVARALAGEVVYVQIGLVDAALPEGQLSAFLLDAAREVVGAALAQPFVERIFGAQRIVAQYHADQRFTRAHLAPRLLFSGVTLTSGRPQPIDPGVIARLLSPPLFLGPTAPSARAWHAPPVYLDACRPLQETLTRALAREARQSWSAELPAFEAELAARRYQVGVELSEEVELLDLGWTTAEATLEAAEASRAAAEAELAAAREAGADRATLAPLRRAVSTQKGQVSRQERVVEEAQRRSLDARIALDARGAWLKAMAQRPREAEPCVYRDALIRVVKAG